MKLRILAAAFLVSSTLAYAAPAAHLWTVPTVVKKLPNGLTVVISPDHTTPTFGICITYGIGYRLEPKGRMGFAHLFEHFMFQGTPDAPKGTFSRVIDGGGGSFNGATRADFTEYTDSAPISALNPVLWLEADRMKMLDFSVTNLNNQRAVVKEEKRSDITNQPYGLFYALDLPEKAYDKFPNNHDFIGDMRDLNAATIQNVEQFYKTYYVPNNAVMTIVGDVNPNQVFATVEKYFGSIPGHPVPPKPDFQESPQTAERQFQEQDHLSRLPALAIGYRMPAPRSHDAIVGVVVADLLYGGKASRLYQSLVQDKKIALSIRGGVDWPMGNPYEFNGPTLMTGFIVYPKTATESQVMSAYDDVVHNLATKKISSTDLENAITKVNSNWYGEMETPVGRAEAISLATLFSGSPALVNDIPRETAGITPADIQAFVRKYLVKTNRTVINRVPAVAIAQGGR